MNRAHRLVAFVSLTTALSAEATPCRAADGPAVPPRTPAVSPLTEELRSLSPEEIERRFQGRTMPEAVRMVIAAKRTGRYVPGEGWFGPAESRFSWNWLAERHGVAATGWIERNAFRGEPAQFARIDRDADGRIAANDFDWSESNPWVQQSYYVFRQFKEMDREGDGLLDRDEWQAFFERTRRAVGREKLTTADLQEAFQNAAVKGARPGDAAAVDATLKGIFSGDIGSPFEGPSVGDAAPDFALKTYDGQSTIRLSEVVGPKPVVLIFGNYTCGRFRTTLPEIEAIAERFAADANFLAVYVREAHAAEGANSSPANRSKGIVIAQPKTYAERTAVATQCGKLLQTSLPLVVDGIDDAVGHAYSGMPVRLYLVDRAGKIAFKAGRGPFGYRPRELEQHLAMLLLERGPTATKPPQP